MLWISFPSRANSCWALLNVPLKLPFKEAFKANNILCSLPATGCSRLLSPLIFFHYQLVVGLDPQRQLYQGHGEPFSYRCVSLVCEDQALFPEPAAPVAGLDSERIKKRCAAPQIFRNSRRGRAYSVFVEMVRNPSALR